MEEDKLSIKINIGDKIYPLRIERNEEELIRKASKLINDKLNQYRTRYEERDMTDLLAMTTLQFTKKYLEMEADNNYSSLVDEIIQINSELESYIIQNK
jgi:cell division protein ZapA (FtsZ GTPase activity inhibitor)